LIAQKHLTHTSVARWTHSKFSRPPRTFPTATEVTAVNKANSYLGFSTRLSKNKRRLRQRRCRREGRIIALPYQGVKKPERIFSVNLVGGRLAASQSTQETDFGRFRSARYSRYWHTSDFGGIHSLHGSSICELTFGGNSRCGHRRRRQLNEHDTLGSHDSESIIFGWQGRPG